MLMMKKTSFRHIITLMAVSIS